MEEQFLEVVQKVHFLKIFKSKRGLNRNIAVRLKEKIKDTDQEIHEELPQSTLTTDVLIDLVKLCREEQNSE